MRAAAMAEVASVLVGNGATVHKRGNGRALRPPGVAVSTTVGSGASCGGCGHGHAMAGGEMLRSWSRRVVQVVGFRVAGKGAGDELWRWWWSVMHGRVATVRR